MSTEVVLFVDEISTVWWFMLSIIHM